MAITMRATTIVTGMAMLRWSRYQPVAWSRPEPASHEPFRHRPELPQRVPSRNDWSRMTQLLELDGSSQMIEQVDDWRRGECQPGCARRRETG